MQGIEIGYCNESIRAVISAWQALYEATASEALDKTQYGKGETGDTLGLDAIPEIIIGEGMRNHDRSSILVTEEVDVEMLKRWPTDPTRYRQPLIYFCDPTDRSSKLKLFIENVSQDRPLEKVGQLLNREERIAKWESLIDKPASITGATSAITCLRKGVIIFSVVLNYITQTIYVAVPDGIYQYELPDYTDPEIERVTLETIMKHGRELLFPLAHETCQTPEEYERFVTFLGKTGYNECFMDSAIFVSEPEKLLHHREPGGPARILYLSDLEKGHGPIGFILANGEKIGEWIHWLGFAKFARNQKGGPKLRVFEIYLKRPHTKDGVLMSTLPAYSIFKTDGEGTFLDPSQLRSFPHPNKFRSMLVITQYDNKRIVHKMRRHNYREIELTF